MTSPEVAGPQAESGVTPQPTLAGAPAILDGTQRALLRAVLNRLVPAHADLAGAGDLDVGATIERSMADSIRLRRLLLDGLAQIAISSRRHKQADFVELDSASQTTVLERVERDWPAFFGALVDHCYRGYYTLALVSRAIGYVGRPPQPLGHEMAPFDPAVLDRQRQRAPFWRQTR